MHDDGSAICDETERFSGFRMSQFYSKLELQSDMEDLWISVEELYFLSRTLLPRKQGRLW